MAGFVGLNVGEYLSRIGLAVGLGGLIGLQRGIDNHPAGLRTHILVSLGSCLFGIYSAYSWESFALVGITVEPTRVSAQVVSGIGFIGGGVIVKQGLDIRGLTTAASIWSSAAIGLLSSVFLWIPALLGTAAIIVFSAVSSNSKFTLEIFKRVEAAAWKKRNTHFIKVSDVKNDAIHKIHSLFAMNGVIVKQSLRESVRENGKTDALFALLLPRHLRISNTLMINLVAGIEGVSRGKVSEIDGKTVKDFMSKMSEKFDFEKDAEATEGGPPQTEDGQQFLRASRILNYVHIPQGSLPGKPKKSSRIFRFKKKWKQKLKKEKQSEETRSPQEEAVSDANIRNE